MIRLRPTRVSIGEEDLNFHLQNIILRHALAAGVHQLGLDFDEQSYEGGTTFIDSDASSTQFYSSPGISDSESESGLDPMFTPKVSYYRRQGNIDASPPSPGSSYRHTVYTPQAEEAVFSSSRSSSSVVKRVSWESSRSSSLDDSITSMDITHLSLVGHWPEQRSHRQSPGSFATQRTRSEIHSLGDDDSLELSTEWDHWMGNSASGRVDRVERVARVGRASTSLLRHPLFIQTIPPPILRHSDIHSWKTPFLNISLNSMPNRGHTSSSNRPIEKLSLETELESENRRTSHSETKGYLDLSADLEIDIPSAVSATATPRPSQGTRLISPLLVDRPEKNTSPLAITMIGSSANINALPKSPRQTTEPSAPRGIPLSIRHENKTPSELNVDDKNDDKDSVQSPHRPTKEASSSGSKSSSSREGIRSSPVHSDDGGVSLRLKRSSDLASRSSLRTHNDKCAYGFDYQQPHEGQRKSSENHHQLYASKASSSTSDIGKRTPATWPMGEHRASNTWSPVNAVQGQDKGTAGVPQECGTPSNVDQATFSRVLEESFAFQDQFNRLVAGLDGEDDTADDFGLRVLRRRPMGDWYHKEV